MRRRLILAGATLMAAISGVPAQQTAKQAETVTVLGCVSPGVEANCLVIKDGKSGKTYDITSAKPRPGPSQMAVQLRGTVSSGASICMQGVILENITWTSTNTRCDSADGGVKASPAPR